MRLRKLTLRSQARGVRRPGDSPPAARSLPARSGLGLGRLFSWRLVVCRVVVGGGPEAGLVGVGLGASGRDRGRR